MSDLAQPLAVQRRWSAHRRQDRPSGLPIGVAASFTAQPLEPFIGVPLLDAGIEAGLHFAEYNQIREVCFDPVAALGPIDRLIILWRIEDMYGAALQRAVAGEAGALGDLGEAAAELGSAV